MIKMNHKRNSESGMIIMASTMGIFIILSLFAFYLARFSITESRSGGYHMVDIKARNLAMTGIEHGIQLFKPSRSISELSGSFNTGDYTVSFDTLNNEINENIRKRFIEGYDYNKLCMHWYDIFKNLSSVSNE